MNQALVPCIARQILKEALTLTLFEGYTCYLVECPSVWICLGSLHDKIQVSTILYPLTLTEKTIIIEALYLQGYLSFLVPSSLVDYFLYLSLMRVF